MKKTVLIKDLRAAVKGGVNVSAANRALAGALNERSDGGRGLPFEYDEAMTDSELDEAMQEIVERGEAVEVENDDELAEASARDGYLGVTVSHGHRPGELSLWAVFLPTLH